MKLTVDLGARGYDIVLKAGALARVRQLANLGGRVLVVTDDGLPGAHLKTLLAQCGSPTVVSLPAGEAHKTVESWQRVLGSLQQAGFVRTDLVLALGGGMVCSVAGFAAASYLGGLPLCLVPTTLAAQCDAAVGGWHMLNHGGQKDAACTLHQPQVVVADPQLLGSLPPRQRAAGMAHALRAALAGCNELLPVLEKGDDDANLERILYLCLQYKKYLVQRDEPLRGEGRKWLLGQTVGHAIQTAQGFAGLLHGEALALGLLPMLESHSLARRAKAVMKRLDLPQKLPLPAQTVAQHFPLAGMGSSGLYTVVRVKKAGQGVLEKIAPEELALLVTDYYTKTTSKPKRF